MSQQDLTVQVATTGVIIAAAVNSVVKGVMASIIGGRAIGIRVGLPLFAVAVGGLVSAWIWVW